ncbi:MAG: arylsulfatase [Akkermansiaceae bacterium]|jgi:arylsulfatase A-like enzyme|nr:arylsulfatase [Akkermansiaceae bacterium]
MLKHFVRLLGSMLSSAMIGQALASLESTHPHVVLIVVDDMGYGDAGCYNPQSKIPTPHIDRIAAEGMKFTDAHAPGPLCHPSRYGLMTGRYPFRTDVSKWPTQPLIDEGQMTLASLLRDAGYATAMVGKWHLGFAERGYDNPMRGGPVDRGFDRFLGLRASTDIPPYFYIRGDRAVAPPTGRIDASRSEEWSPIQGEFWREGDIAPDMQLDKVLPRFTDEAVSIIESHDPRKPLMLYLAYPAPHTPWLPAPAFRGKSGAGTYGDFMMMTDHEIGRVCDALDAAGISSNTLLVFTSDNGPVWYPRDVERFGHDSVGGLRGMKGDAWEGGHRMPFIVRWPGHVAAGASSDQTICLTDLMATLAEVIGKTLPPGAGPDSFSLLPVLEGRQPVNKPVRGPIIMRSGSSGAMLIRSGDWKMIDQPGSGGFSKSPQPRPGDPPGQLYNLRDDPSERNNLYHKDPERVAGLSRLMQQIVNTPASRPQ